MRPSIATPNILLCRAGKLIGANARFLLLALLCFGACPPAAATVERKPNLVLILVDDAGYDDFGFTGCTDWKTPNIDRIATGGVTFTDAYVTASVCGPSRAGLITGRYQQSFGHEENLTGGLAVPVPVEKFGLPLKIPTLGRLLRDEGYATAAFGKWHLGEHDHFHPNERGFDHFVGFLGGHRSFWPLSQKAHRGHKLMVNRQVTKTPEYLTDHLGKAAVEFIDRHTDQPFFVYLAYNAVHSPLHATDDDLKALDHIKDKRRRVLGAMTIALDRSVGHVLDCLKKNRLEEDTVVVFTNDNGAATYLKTNNGGLRGRKGTVWEGGLRVPFAMRWPGQIKSGIRNRTPINTLDIGYTFCRQAGQSVVTLSKRKLSGSNLIELAKGQTSERALFWRRGNTSAIREGDWKLITLKNKPTFLFDVASDRREENNLIDSQQSRAARLLSKLSIWNRSLPSPLWRKKASDSYDQFLLKYWNAK